MSPRLVEEIDKRTYNPNIYYTSLDPQTRSYRAKKKVSKTTPSSQFRSVKRVNYSLADMEAKLYQQQSNNNTTATDESTVFKTSTKEALQKFTPQQILQSKRRFMELDTENVQDLSEIPTLLSSITGMNKDKVDSNTTTISHFNGDLNLRSNRYKVDIPNSVLVSYRSTKPPKPKKKNTNRQVALKKILTVRRPFHVYVDSMNQADRSMILQNVYNKKYFKVLPLMTICSICGGFDSISGCVKCGDKICSLNCFNLHNETRCIHR
ncbi:vacuolar protein sorting-associated protein 71 [Monosporozyma unispora]|nr:hypothetical protein C6P44_004549 [Kazachstania unispora]